ncbi:ATP-dependent protease ATPase subunit HslU [Candidatus Hepatincolaceae symbiont of Richtersius coronifer]
MKDFTPAEIVTELNKYIIGQNSAKRQVAIALRHRFRRRLLNDELKSEVTPKNILMIGPTGVGKTEIARRLAKLDDSPFIKVEATKFTEVGYVGRDVEQIIRDLIEVAIQLKSDELKEGVKYKAKELALERIVNISVVETPSAETKKKFSEKIKSGALDHTEIEIKVKDKSQALFEVPGMQGSQLGMLNIDSLLGKEKFKNKKTTLKRAVEIFTEEEMDNLTDKETIISEAIEAVENNGIVFIDEIDKISSSQGDRHSGNVSREGVQRDLLPLVEGTVVATKYGPIKTDHILFIASGAFHSSKPSDLLPELQGRFPIRVELSALNKQDFKRILLEPQFNLIIQNTKMLETEGVTLVFAEEAIDEIAHLTEFFNQKVENIGARRLHTIMEKILEDINFDAPNSKDQTIVITKELIKDKLEYLTKENDLSKFII